MSLRYQITLRKTSPAGEAGVSRSPGKFRRIETAVAAFLVFSTAIGVLIAAFVFGSVLAILILTVATVAIFVWIFFRFWHRWIAKARNR